MLIFSIIVGLYNLLMIQILLHQTFFYYHPQIFELIYFAQVKTKYFKVFIF